VALIPIRNKDKIIGLIQFNDRRKGCFTRQIIGYLEGIASHIGEALLRKQTEETIRASLREKESLLKEIHHRVKNNLQVISSLLNLQSHQLDSPIAKAVLKDTQSRVRSMALIHEHLYRSENLAAVDMVAYLRQLCTQLFRTLLSSPGTVKLNIDIAEFRLVIDQAIPCGLLVNELVSNSLKHAFPEGRTGEIRVELQPVEGGFLRLKISDNGTGLPQGFELKNLTSLGLNLVSDLSHQMGGKLGIGPGPGAVFEVTFKAKKL
jgi:two-component sensor histidine kinase